MPRAITDLFTTYDYQIVGIWNQDREPEVYYMGMEPEEEVSFAFSNLSQSFQF